MPLPESRRAYEALPLTRRRALHRLALSAGVAAPVLSLLDGSVPALAKSEETDFGILYAALALEHHAVWLYRQGLERKLFPAGLRAYAVEFMGDHEGHRDTQVAIAEERGGRPPSTFASYPAGPLASSEHLLGQACLIEEAAQDAYLALISEIRTQDYLLSAGFILVDEVRHLTVWKRVLGRKTW
ncbi:MAG TPA: DUF4439 domain-containing protein [Vicinamibacteria bacterium]